MEGRYMGAMFGWQEHLQAYYEVFNDLALCAKTWQYRLLGLRTMTRFSFKSYGQRKMLKR